MKLRISVTLLIFVLLFSGCRKKQPDVSPPVPLPLAQIARDLGPPAQFNVLKTNAVDIMEDISLKDWSSAQDKVTSISNSLNELQPVLDSTKVSQETISGITGAVNGLAGAVAAKKQYDALSQANLITEFIPDIADHYVTGVPSDVMRLGYLARELMLDIRYEDWTSAADDLNAAEGVWIRTKSKLRASLQHEIGSFQGSLDRLKSAVAQKGTTSASHEVKALLNSIESMEQNAADKNDDR
jgi:hypothetical protein